MEYEAVYEAIVRLADDLTRRSFPKLPPERDLAERLNTSRTTVRRALAALEQQAVIRRVKGRSGGAYLNGVIVQEPWADDADDEGTRKLQRSLNQVVGVPEMLRTQGFTSGARVVNAAFEPPPAAAAQFLELDANSLVASIVRIRFADGDSLSLERLCVNPQRFPGLFEHDLHGSMVELFNKQYGIVAGKSEEEIEACVASHHVASMLGVDPGAALIKLTRRAVDQNGRPYEFSVDLFRSDRTRLIVSTGTSDARVHPETSR